MGKSLLTISTLAVLVLVGCNKEALKGEAASAINFAGHAIDFSTYSGRVLTKNESLCNDTNAKFTKAIKVYCVGHSSLDNKEFKYDKTSQLYIPKKGQYYWEAPTHTFYAVCPASIEIESSGGSYGFTIDTYGDTDIMTAYAPDASITVPNVPLTIKHTLSQIGVVLILNDLPADYTVEITGTKISDIYMSGTCVISDSDTWETSGDVSDLEFDDITIESPGAVVLGSKYMIPQNADTFSLTYTLKSGSEVKYEKTINYDFPEGKKTFLGGTKYSISVLLSLEEIKFDISGASWTSANPTEIK